MPGALFMPGEHSLNDLPLRVGSNRDLDRIATELTGIAVIQPQKPGGGPTLPLLEDADTEWAPIAAAIPLCGEAAAVSIVAELSPKQAELVAAVMDGCPMPAGRPSDELMERLGHPTATAAQRRNARSAVVSLWRTTRSRLVDLWAEAPPAIDRARLKSSREGNGHRS
ncbi:hypothetical protein FPZ12_029520 [Amycolatopsis acidicola]|uniref:Uncharacterized protein n=1 Tax=Amycolatopsis acidicola TaxID=2596893 RepID=A0A5N0UTH9_9PSEU|nr:hypothetical protein [Amycolatopsis acidicola]KAA9155537.1 hypothetical protein FPZ12_029520 [Amycolatopsis acidicola]